MTDQPFWMDCMENVQYEDIPASDIEIGDVVILNSDEDDECGTWYVYDIDYMEMHDVPYVVLKGSRINEGTRDSDQFDTHLIEETTIVTRRVNPDSED